MDSFRRVGIVEDEAAEISFSNEKLVLHLHDAVLHALGSQSPRADLLQVLPSEALDFDGPSGSREPVEARPEFAVLRPFAAGGEREIIVLLTPEFKCGGLKENPAPDGKRIRFARLG